ncbi:MarR family winged helix-turn-helix transcriptional regulator [Bacillus massiliglaciei]|uniref:MarR family winged helix-turn-helix transcriptional regulator n=1 Tax=Bacillus massiliglaciei TaxID=1816693 RepID=UPI000DA61A8C|nr:MarR family transcriptional regulator [Bacillus massiliglaciei]
MPFHDQFFHRYLQVSRSFTKALNGCLAEINLYQSQWSIIFYLSNYGPSALVEISSYLDVEKPTITRTVNRLEERGLVEQISAKDKREKKIQLTSMGKDIYEEGCRIVDSFEANLLEGIPEEERKTILGALDQLETKLKQ